MDIKELWKNVQAFWTELDDRRRAGLVAGAAAIVLLVVGLSYWMLHTDYQVLFSGLDESNGSAVVDELKKRKIPYELSDNGTKVLVPASAVHETRMALMSKGALLNGGVGFEIFDNKDLGMTEYTQKINYQRAMQGELSRTISTIEQVKTARVHLVVPETSLFKRDKSRSKASVSLLLKPGTQLSAEQVVGIQRLVAAAVPGLDPSLVTVFDQRGVTLSTMNEGDDPVAGNSGRLRMQREAEAYLTRKIAEVLDRTYGPGKAIVSVDVALNFDEIKRTQHDVIPVGNRGEESGIAVRKRQVIYRQGGAPSVKASDTEAASPAGGMNSTTEVEYEIGRRVEEVVMAPGGVRRISVGVLVPQHMTEDQLKTVRAVVSATAGLNESRGDAIVVHAVDELIAAGNTTGNATPSLPGDAVLGESVAAEGSALNVIEQVVARIPGRWLTIAGAALAMLVAVLFFVGIQVRAHRRVVAQRAIVEEQRASLLAEIKGWIEAEKSGATGVTNG